MKQMNISSQELILLILFAILISYLFISAQSSLQPNYEFVIEIEVSEGDTLWSLANHYSEGISIQAYISLLKNKNELQQDLIYPGQKLLIPQLDDNEVAINEGDYLLSSKH